MSPVEPSEKPSVAKRVLGLLKPLFGAAILAFVAWTLPWKDQLTWVPRVDAETFGDPVSLEGRIDGDWKSDAVQFFAGAEAEAPESWPEDLRAAVATGEPFEVVRHDEGSPSARPDGLVDWKPSMQRAFLDVEPGGLAIGFAFFLVAMSVATLRWWRLLSLVGCVTTYWNTLRLTLLGLFFNLVVPGLTGGDVVKGVIVARENPGRRADALVSVVVDRVLGLITLLALAATVIVLSGDRFAEIRTSTLLVLVAGVGGAILYVNPALRRVLRFEERLAKLPGGRRLGLVDKAALRYAERPGEIALAVLLSIANHSLVILGVVALARAFGVSADDVSVAQAFVIVPVANVITAIPATPGGWGLGEATYKWLFELVGASGSLGVATSVTFRLCQMALGACGGIFLLLPGAKQTMEEIRAGEAESTGGDSGSDSDSKAPAA